MDSMTVDMEAETDAPEEPQGRQCAFCHKAWAALRLAFGLIFVASSVDLLSRGALARMVGTPKTGEDKPLHHPPYATHPLSPAPPTPPPHAHPTQEPAPP